MHWLDCRNGALKKNTLNIYIGMEHYIRWNATLINNHSGPHSFVISLYSFWKLWCNIYIDFTFICSQVKHIHEYKLQLLDILHGDCLPLQMDERNECSKRKAKYVCYVRIFGGKASATYVQTESIVKFIWDVMSTVNHGTEICDLLKAQLFW